MKLHPIPKATEHGGRIYCGPAALIAVTGHDYPTVREAINRGRGYRATSPVRGIFNSNLKAGAARLGIKLKERDVPGNLTLAAWLRSRKPEDVAKTFIVNLTTHYVVVKGRKFIDNHTKEPVWIGDAPHRRKRVKRIFEVSRCAPAKVVNFSTLRPKPKPKPPGLERVWEVVFYDEHGESIDIEKFDKYPGHPVDPSHAVRLVTFDRDGRGGEAFIEFDDDGPIVPERDDYGKPVPKRYRNEVLNCSKPFTL